MLGISSRNESTELDLTCYALQEVMIEPLLGIHGGSSENELMSSSPGVVWVRLSLSLSFHRGHGQYEGLCSLWMGL